METFPENDNLLVTEAMLQHLPAPVQRYLRYTGVVGKPWVRTARVKRLLAVLRFTTQFPCRERLQ